MFRQYGTALLHAHHMDCPGLSRERQTSRSHFPVGRQTSDRCLLQEVTLWYRHRKYAHLWHIRRSWRIWYPIARWYPIPGRFWRMRYSVIHGWDDNVSVQVFPERFDWGDQRKYLSTPLVSDLFPLWQSKCHYDLVKYPVPVRSWSPGHTF